MDSLDNQRVVEICENVESAQISVVKAWEFVFSLFLFWFSFSIRSRLSYSISLELSLV